MGLQTGKGGIVNIDRSRFTSGDWRSAWDSEGADGIERLLSAGADVRARDRDGSTCLFRPAAEGNLPLLKALIAAGADVNAHNDVGETPMLVAAREGQVAAVRVLLRSRAKPIVRDDSGTTPLHLAAGHGDAGLVNVLLDWRPNDEHVDVDARDGEGRTPLHFVAGCDDRWLEVAGVTAPLPGLVMERLVAADADPNFNIRGADPNTRDNYGRTPLQVAAEQGSPDMVCGLLKRGASAETVDHYGMTPLHCLVQRDREEDAELRAFKALIASGADPNGTDHLGCTPLHYASGSEHEDEATFAKALLDAGAKPNSRDRGRRRTPLHYAVAEGGLIAVVRALVDGGADANATDEGREETPLHMVARHGDPELAELLISAGATHYAEDCDFKTPLHVAVEAGNAKVARVLVAAGADPYRGGYSDWSPIKEADESELGQEMVWALVGDPNKRDENGRTPLHEAAGIRLQNWLNALLEAGADPNVRDKDGRTPLHEVGASDGACAEALTAAGADSTIQDKDGDTPFQERFPSRRGRRRS